MDLYNDFRTPLSTFIRAVEESGIIADQLVNHLNLENAHMYTIMAIAITDSAIHYEVVNESTSEFVQGVILIDEYLDFLQEKHAND
jgi:hypothetical protein